MKKLTLLFAAMAICATAFAGVITEQPAGTLKNYTRKGCCVICDYEEGFYVAYQEGKVSIVYAEDGKVYMKNPIMAMSYNTWVEGTLSEDGKTITIPMGQTLYHSDNYDADVILSWGSTSEGMINWDTWELEVNYTPDESAEAAIFTIDGETIRLEGSQGTPMGDLTGEDLAEFAATGLSAIWADNHAWVQTIEWGTVLTELPAPKPAVPANPEAVAWRDSGSESGYSRFEFNINPYDVDGNPLDTEQASLTYSIFTDNDDLFVFDAETYYWDFYGVEMTEIPYGQYSYNFSPQSVFFYRTNAEGYERFFDWRIGIQVYYTVDGVRNASDIVYLEVFPAPEPGEQTAPPSISADTQMGVHAYFVTITESEPSDLYYRYCKDEGEWSDWILYDGVVAFEEDGYYQVEAYAIANGKSESLHVGASFVVTPRTGLDEMNVEKTVAGVRYYNMAGQEMAQPSGMTIQVTTYTDGTTSTVKVIK